MSKLSECSSCFQRFQNHYPFCPYCGGKAEDKLTMGVLFNNTISNYFSVDARFFKSFWPLLIKPGYLAKQFVHGRRKRYLHPAQMYLFVSVIFFFLFSFITREQSETIDTALKKDIDRSNAAYRNSQKEQSQNFHINLPSKNDNKLTSAENIKNQIKLNTSDSVVRKNNQSNNSIFGMVFSEIKLDSMITAGSTDKEMYEYMGMKSTDGYFKKRLFKQTVKFFKTKSGGSILQAFYDSIPLAMFILLPIFALILYVFYFKKGTFAHHLIFSFYYFAFLFMIFSFLVIGELLWKNFPGWLLFLIMISTFFYLFLGLKNYYDQGYGLSFIKSSVISFVFLSIVLPFAAMVMGMMAFLFY